MALKRLTIDGYGQIELNSVAFRREGRIEAMCALDATDFATLPAENGMLLAVDRVARAVKFPGSAEVTAKLPIAVNYTTEHMYDERLPGLKNFKLVRGTFLPRLGYLAVGDLFTTNCLAFLEAEFANEDAVLAAIAAYATTALYGGISDNGAIILTATAPVAGPVLRVVEKTTMPDGQLGLKFQVYSA